MHEKKARYKVTFLPNAEKNLENLDKPVAERAVRKIEWLAKNALVIVHHFLIPPPDDLAGLARIRSGDYRILYWVHHDTREIFVYGVEHRSRVYKRLK